MSIPVAYLGPDGTYSHLAVQQFQPQVSLQVPCTTIDQVFAAILTDQAQCGLVPLYNSASGLVSDTAESILRRLLGVDTLAEHVWWKRPLCISGSAFLSVRHCLVGFGRLEQVRRVISKQQAMDQCHNWLKHHVGAAVLEASDSSAGALPMLIDDPSVAAIVSLQAAQAAGVPVLVEDIQDLHQNVTEFVVVQRDDQLGYVSYGERTTPEHEYWVSEEMTDPAEVIWLGELPFAGRRFQFVKRRTKVTFRSGQPVTLEEMGRWRLGVS